MHKPPKQTYCMTPPKTLLDSSCHPRVLLADNDPLTCHTFSLLESQGYQVISVADGREAYRMLKKDANFNLAIFNMNLPRLDGLDIVRYMKTEKRLMDIPIVVLSCDQSVKSMAESFAAGALVVLTNLFHVTNCDA